MSNNLRPSLKDFLMTNLILHKCSEDIENPKYFLKLLNLSKNSKNKPLFKSNNINKDFFLNKNMYISNKSEKEKDKKSENKIRDNNDLLNKNYIKKISSHIPILYPLSKLNIKKSIRYIYDNNNYYKKKDNSNNDNLAKQILFVQKYKENRNKEQFIKSFSFIISKYKTEKKIIIKLQIQIKEIIIIESINI